ncbi:MAG: hypothetical protein Q8Q09_29410 [Deltaproteobacteria bacterium]|nr:hypothetical protein [Deltaproteobacteria bacterium]
MSKASTRGASEDAPPAAPPPHAHIFIYTIAERFAPNTWISHKTFGVGVVIRELALNKIEVRFDSGTKVLVQNTPTAS